ncbi:MAG: peptidase [Rhodobacterales bacterium]
MRNRSLADYEQPLKWLALILGLLSTIAIVENWYPWPMFLGLPFCIIWIYCAWLHTERQLKYINIIFAAVYTFGIAKYLLGA